MKNVYQRLSILSLFSLLMAFQVPAHALIVSIEEINISRAPDGAVFTCGYIRKSSRWVPGKITSNFSSGQDRVKFVPLRRTIKRFVLELRTGSQSSVNRKRLLKRLKKLKTYNQIALRYCAPLPIPKVLTPTPVPTPRHFPDHYGDMNCDGRIDNGDIDGFVYAFESLTRYFEIYPNCNPYNGDMNADGKLQQEDLSTFISLLLRPLAQSTTQPTILRRS